ncbi:MAG: DUF1549 domain-containing protein [Planctomycetaceae bacterium]|nr:DUF1549 domain-containing protein [Planctomycetaceae bacterium]
MSTTHSGQTELLKMMEAACEDRLSAEQVVRLEELLTDSEKARKLYREYMLLHGMLYWDTAVGSETDAELSQTSSACTIPAATIPTTSPAPAGLKPSRILRSAWIAGLVSALAIIVGVFLSADPSSSSSDEVTANMSPELSADRETLAENQAETPAAERQPAKIQAIVAVDDTADLTPSQKPLQNANSNPAEKELQEIPAAGSSDPTILAYVNDELHSNWVANSITPSPVAEDSEWLRRVHLDLIGQIPTADEAAEFLASNDPRKREKVVDTLLQRPEFITNWSTIWANLMVGRNPDRDEYRTALTKYLRDSFRDNRPWDEMVAAVIAAEGSVQDNQASGFLLAHVNNQAVPATAIASRLFLGTNVQCTQCHDHPFNDSKQNQFWELNSFFKQTEKVVKRRRDPSTGNMLQTVSLVTKRDAEGPTFFENRQGRVQPAYPIYNGVKVDESAGTNRRQELARLLAAGEKPQIAEAFVNRTWKHFFGFGFTNPVDDMGPHNPPSHPELLDRLAREFVASGYDQKRLMRWICLSDAYGRTSRLTEQNQIDNPELGELPLFSRVYVKSMSAEQVYNSLLVATGVLGAQNGSWEEIEHQRSQWLQQFIHAYETEENNEDTHFSGTIAQALMLMNGEMIEEAISAKSPTFFGKLMNSKINDERKVEQLALSALTRYPTDREMSLIRKMVAQNVANSRNQKNAYTQSLQDVFWAYLNSSEFVLVH